MLAEMDARKEQVPDMDSGEREKQERLKAAAHRAKAEAQARRERMDKADGGKPKEIDGRGGLDPVRYDDWEIKGLTSDF